MANYQFSSDLVDDILFRAGEPTDGSSDFESAALQYLNRAYQALSLGGSEIEATVNEPWWWLFKESNFVVPTKINTGTVSVTALASSIEFSTSPTVSVADYWLMVSGDNDLYKVASHVAAASGATLDSKFTGSTATGANFNCFQTDFTLATDVLRLVTPMWIAQTNASAGSYGLSGRNYQILGISNRAMDEVAPVPLFASGMPKFFAQVTENKVRINSFTTSPFRINYAYLQRPADLTDSVSEEPVVPRQYRKTLADIGLFFLFLDKNDSRADGVGLVARNAIKAMALENRVRLQSYGTRIRQFAPVPVLEMIGQRDAPIPAQIPEENRIVSPGR